MNLSNRYILYLRDEQKVIITSDGPVIASKVGKSPHTVRSWFRDANTVVDRYDTEGFILVKGGEFVKSRRGSKGGFKKKAKYNW